jgi:hypothetical protein
MMTNKNMSKAEIWRKRLGEQSTSGKSQAKYCAENGIAINTFLYWKRKLSPKPDSIFVKMNGIPERNGTCTLIRAGGVRLILKPVVSEQLANALLAVLRSA